MPIRLRDRVIGALILLSIGKTPLGAQELRLGQALADVATIGLLQERNVRQAGIVNKQLQGALDSRVVIEPAKSKLAERHAMDMDQAFTLLRQYARTTNQRLTDVANCITDSPAADFPPQPR